MKEKLIRVAEAAKIASVSKQVIYKWLAGGKIARYEAANITLVDQDELEKFISPKRIN